MGRLTAKVASFVEPKKVMFLLHTYLMYSIISLLYCIFSYFICHFTATLFVVLFHFICDWLEIRMSFASGVILLHLIVATGCWNCFDRIVPCVLTKQMY